MQEMQVWSPGQEVPLKKEMATQSSILTWEIYRQRRLVGYSPWRGKRVRHDVVNKTRTTITKLGNLNLCTTVPFTVSNTKKICNKHLSLKLLNISLLPNINKHCAKNQGRKNKRTRHGTCSQRVIFLFRRNNTGKIQKRVTHHHYSLTLLWKC